MEDGTTVALWTVKWENTVKVSYHETFLLSWSHGQSDLSSGRHTERYEESFQSALS